MKSEVLAWVPRRQELVHHTPQDQSSTPGHPGAVVTSTSTSYFKFTHKSDVQRVRADVSSRLKMVLRTHMSIAVVRAPGVCGGVDPAIQARVRSVSNACLAAPPLAPTPSRSPLDLPSILFFLTICRASRIAAQVRRVAAAPGLRVSGLSCVCPPRIMADDSGQYREGFQIFGAQRHIRPYLSYLCRRRDRNHLLIAR